jgi:7,8-dihydro-6-hydroxymethylpterin-pyrophosphokinase
MSSSYDALTNSEVNNNVKSRTDSSVKAASLLKEKDIASKYLYLNAVTEISTTLSPSELLTELQQIEAQLGRTPPNNITNDREEHNLSSPEATKVWEPRTIDLDILTYGKQCISTEKLTIPHPELHLRDFVLIPLQEIAPEFRHPALESSIGELLQRLHRHFVTGKSIPCRIASIKYQVNESKIEAIDESKLASFA